jgi:glycerol uptake facilitator protein
MSAARSATRRVQVSTAPSDTQKLAAELVGTAFLTGIGTSAVVATEKLLAAGKTSLSEADLGFIAFAFALALAIAIYSIGKVSGGHFNPAVTVAMLATRRIEPAQAGLYFAAQLVGAIIGSLGVIVIWGTSVAKSTSLGVTSFSSPTNAFQAAVAEAIGAFIFLFVITAMAADPRAPAGWAGLIIGLTLGVVILMMGPVTGASLNPARSFGPMLVKTIFGGKVDWGQIWVYLIGPIVGGVLGAFAYDVIADTRRAKA